MFSLLFFWVLFNNQNTTLGTSLGRYKVLENQSISKPNQETDCCSLKFHLQQLNTEACKVFDESPTPKQEGFPNFFNLEYFSGIRA
jgi:hypothetical protein